MPKLVAATISPSAGDVDRSFRSRVQTPLPDHCRDLLQISAGDDFFEQARGAAPPIGVLFNCAGKVRLLALADNILELNEHQASPRAREIGQNCANELGGMNGLSVLRKKPSETLRRKKSFLDERLEQQVAITAALCCRYLGFIGFRMEIKTPAPREVTPEPETFERSHVVCRRRSDRKGWILGGRNESPVLPALEYEHSVGQHIGRPHRLTKTSRHGSEVLTDHCTTLSMALQGNEPQEIVKWIGHVGASSASIPDGIQ